MIPISTDAPIYYLPIATVTTIVLNVVCFFAFCLNDVSNEVALVTPDGRTITSDEQLAFEMSQYETAQEVRQFLDSLTKQGGGWVHALSVEFGKFKPWQWVTNNFMHAGWMHLIGNMVFLWAFGLVVEGKVGPFVFALIYLGIGTVYGCVLQLCSLVIGWEGIALGASAAIFGLLALCVVWAPANDFTVLLKFSTFDISILIYGAFFFAKEAGFWALSNFQMSSELLHIIGFVVALPLGFWMVTAGKVDCEGWDLISYWSGKTGNESTVGKSIDDDRRAVKKEKPKAKSPQQIAQEAAELAESTRRMQDQVQTAIDEGRIEVAIKLQNRITQTNPTIEWKQKDLFRVIQALLKTKDYPQALPLLAKHIELFEQSRFAMQTAMMKIWLSQREAKKTLRYLQGFNTAFLSPEELAQLKPIAAAAKKQIASEHQDA